jgi:integrase
VAREATRLRAFQRQHCIDGLDAVILYLINLVDGESLNADQVRYRLLLLDKAAARDGQPVPSRNRVVRTTMRGLYREVARSRSREPQPLYLEDVAAMLDALRAERLPQQQDVSLVLLANATGMTTRALRSLTWADVRVRREGLTLRVPPSVATYGPRGEMAVSVDQFPRTVEAVRDLRRLAGPVPGPVYAMRPGRAASAARARSVLRGAPGRGKQWTWEVATPSPEASLEQCLAVLQRPRLTQLRDAALVTLAFSGCLSSVEATRLCCGDVQVSERGLELHIAGRQRPTGVPYSRGRHCPVGYWTAWLAALDEHGRASPKAPAFPGVRGEVVTGSSGLEAVELIRIVKRRAVAAGLQGEFSFTSLRIGFIRTAARAGVPAPLILQQAGLRTMRGLLLHVRRERLLSDSVAGRVGL